MNKILLIGIIIVITVMVVFMIAVLTIGFLNAVESAIWFWIPLALWIYLVSVAWKKKTGIFSELMEPKLSERRLKKLKIFLLASGISFVMFWLNILLPNVTFNPPEQEGIVGFLIAFFSAVLFVISAMGRLVVFLRGRETYSK